MTEEPGRSGHDVVIRHGVEIRLAVHRYIPNELAISSSCQDITDAVFASSVEGV